MHIRWVVRRTSIQSPLRVLLATEEGMSFGVNNLENSTAAKCQAYYEIQDTQGLDTKRTANGEMRNRIMCCFQLGLAHSSPKYMVTQPFGF